MKKKVLVLFLCLSIFLAGCSTTSILNASKNVNEYKLAVEFFDETKSLKGNEIVTYINKSDAVLEEVCFHLYANAFREESQNKVVGISSYNKAYPNGVSYGKIDIISVKDGNKTYEFYIGGIDNNILIVKLPSQLYPNDKVNIEIEFEVQLANINHRLGYGNNCINFGNFYPIACVYENGSFVTDPYSSNGDPFYSNISNYEVCIKFDKKFVIASTGEMKEEIVEDKKIVTAKADAVRDFIFVLSEKFKILEKTYDGVDVKYYYYGDETPEKSLQASVDTLATNNSMIGKYPYKTLSVVESNFVHGGMEYPTLVLISDDINDNSTYLNVIVHEIGHQWWYGVVGNDQYNYGWLDEGLTEYTTAVFYERNKDYELSKENVISNGINSYCVFVKVYNSVYGSVDTSMTRSLGDYKTEPEYVYIAYLKGMLMFDSLRNIVGDKLFFKSLQEYYETYAFKEVRPEHLIYIFEKVCNRNLESFFNSWINGEVVIMNG